jgi:hypothetical protein
MDGRSVALTHRATPITIVIPADAAMMVRRGLSAATLEYWIARRSLSSGSPKARPGGGRCSACAGIVHPSAQPRS